MTYCPLDLVESYLRRFVAYPHEHAVVAHTLWIAHTHLIECADTTPRLAFMSAEKASGKTRALEVTELFVPDPLMAFSLSPAVAVRLVSQRRRTVLLDEIDSIFGNAKRQEANGDLCAPGEQVEAFRLRYHPAEAKPIKESLEEWAEQHEGRIGGAEPELPGGLRTGTLIFGNR